MKATSSQVVDPTAPQFVSRQVETSRLFWYDLSPDSSADGVVVGGGYEVCRPDFRIDRRDFAWITVEFVGSGRGHVEMSGQRVDLRPGSFFVYGPGVEHHIGANPADPLKKYFMVLAGAGLEALAKRLELSPGSITESTNPAAMARAFDDLITRGSKRSELGHEICLTLARQILLMAREDSLDVGLADTRAFQTYRRVREVIEADHLKITTLEGIAIRCELDAAYLCRLFSRFQEETPYQHLTRLRMEHAARRLIEGDLSVKAVSEELGFRDPFHFSRVFKSVHRVPPSQFRGGRKDGSLGAV